MSREFVFGNTGTDFSGLKVFQDAEVREDKLYQRDLKYLETF